MGGDLDQALKAHKSTSLKCEKNVSRRILKTGAYLLFCAHIIFIFRKTFETMEIGKTPTIVVAKM